MSSDDITRIEVKNKEVLEFLNRMMGHLTNTEPMMRTIARKLRNAAMAQFDAESGPDGQAWQDLAESTKTQREKHKTWPDGKMLNVSAGGGLYGSIQTEYGSDYAQVGTNKVYGRIHQFGGQAGRGLLVTIPPRPYLPISADGELSTEAEIDILDVMKNYLNSAKI